MATLFQRHCSDESLICHLDGELPFYRRRGVRLHLQKCWQCRLRLSEIESQVLEATRSMQQDAFPGPQRIAEARMKFLASADAVAEEVFGARKRPKSEIGLRRLAWAAACVAVIGLFSWWRFAGREPAASTAAEVVKRVQAVEAQAARVPAHQRFRVVARQLRPAPASRESRLELWSDPDQGRFTTRFSDRAGLLRHAVWQPAPGRQFVYRARAAQVVSFSRQEAQERWDGILFRDGLTLEDFEAALLTWLENRPWRPVSFASGIAILATADGAALKVEEVRGAGQRFLRLRARKAAGPVTVEFTLDVNERTYKPELQSIRYESPARTLELQLYSEPAGPVAPASFEPPASLTRTAPAPIPLPPAIPPDVQRLPAAQDVTLLEVEVHYALHRIRACIGEALEVNRTPDGIVKVRAAVASPERKAQLVAVLAPFAGPYVKVDIKSADEILREISPETVTVDRTPQARTSDRRGFIKHLSRYFAGSETEAREFADKVLSAGESLMQHAQALRHLAEQFGGRTDIASSRAQVLLELMYEEHLRDLDGEVKSTLLLLGPVLGGAVTREEPALISGERWDAESLRIFELTRVLNDTLRQAFTGEHSTFDDERLLREIRDAVAPLQFRVRAASEGALKARRTM